jgi:hypothetical protein
MADVLMPNAKSCVPNAAVVSVSHEDPEFTVFIIAPFEAAKYATAVETIEMT